ncbi:hypothetical protein [Sphingobacterium bovistauri]|uniref:Phospholipase_D-nuclease N-terminal n=1 Tax=Sphingobacterium bovistauri TaxID=2781959 RepID=A0ABS7Z9G4_9SPHI|nr:hypothetical protein [Sphingobacterium bovistauri]MCA5006648.1 hypothetical protein [Sphingobacterium bovistauri]
MNIDKALLVNIVLLIHMALTGIMLFRLFKLKNATGGQLVLTFLGLMIPVIGPSALIVYYNNFAKKSDNNKPKVTNTSTKSHNRGKK